MKLSKPITYMGKPVKGAIDEFLRKLEKQEQQQPPALQIPITAPANIAPDEYIQIPNTNILIAQFRPDFTKGFKWLPNDQTKLQSEGVFYQLSQRGLTMPTPAQYMSFFNNVIDAYNNKIQLHYANATPLTKQQIEDLYKHQTTAHIQGGEWTWLNARFVKGSGFKNLDLETVVNVNSDGTLTTAKEPLSDCIDKDCYVDLEFNQQGFPIKKSKTQEYFQGKNIYFYYPRENYVARFLADSDRASLNCGRYPDYRDASLGVRCVARTSDLTGGKN